LIYFWGLIGAALYIGISFLIILMVNNYYAKVKILKRINISFRSIFQSKVNKKAIKELYVFAGVGLIAGAAIIFSETLIRSIIVTKLGINKIGVYSPIILWSGLFTGFILPSIGTYLYPRFSEVKSDNELNGILNDS